MKYVNTSHAIVRIPRYPEALIHKVLNDDAFFDGIISSIDFRTAVFISSPSLSYEHDKYMNGNLKGNQRSRIKQTLIKYLSRMSTRCTPFATMASCAAVEIGNEDRIEVSDEIKINFRLDMLCLCALSHALQQKESFRLFTRYKTNTTVYKVGKYVRFIRCNYDKNGRGYSIEQVKSSKLLEYVLDACTTYNSFQDLLHKITSEYDVTENEAKNYINLLIDYQLLISECEPLITGEDYYFYLQEKIKDLGEASNRNSLAQIANELIAIADDKKLLNISYHYDTIAHILDSYDIKYDKKYLIQADSFRVLDNNVISTQLIDQVNRCLTLLSKITPRYEDGLISDFKKRFTNRYGDMEVTLLEALDPDIGIGYIIKKDNTPNSLLAGLSLPTIARKFGQLTLTPLTKLLLKKLFAFNPKANKSIDITDEDVKDIDGNMSDLPLSLAAFFKIRSKNEDGSYQLADLHFSGASAANMLGRFAYGDSSIESIVKTVTKCEQDLIGNDSVIAEIIHLPESRTGNVLFRPHIRDYEIAYLTNSTLNEENIIPVNDLYVSIKNNKIVLRSKRLNKEVIPRLTTAHNFKRNTTPIYRFLCDLQSQSVRTSLYFSWCGLEYVYEFLPRVNYESIILSPAKWFLKKEHFMNNSKIDMDAVKVWRETKHLPQHVNLVVGDNKLFIDLDNVISVGILFKEVAKMDRFTIEEYLPSSGIVTDKKGNSYNNEFLIPYVKR